MPSSMNEFGSRYISISNPLSSVDIARQRRRARLKEIFKQIWQITCYGHHFKSSWIFRLLVGIAWALTVVLASPQAIIWRVLKHPDIQPDFYQVSRDAKCDELGESVHAIFPPICDNSLWCLCSCLWPFYAIMLVICTFTPFLSKFRGRKYISGNSCAF